MNILALEASSDACSCALKTAATLDERHEIAPRRHTELLLPMVEALLAGRGLALRELDCIAFGSGPGSFTGVRIAACVAQGLALAAGTPVAPVSSLAALAARGGKPGERVLACLDARMGEVYLGAFAVSATGLAEALAPERIGTPQSVELPTGGAWVAVGSGWATYATVLAARLARPPLRMHPDLHPGAAQVALLAAGSGAAGPPADAAPAYLRREVAQPSAARRAAVENESR